MPRRAGAGNGYWLANLRPPFDARPMTYAGADFDGSGSVTARATSGAAGDCGSVEPLDVERLPLRADLRRHAAACAAA